MKRQSGVKGPRMFLNTLLQFRFWKLLPLCLLLSTRTVGAPQSESWPEEGSNQPKIRMGIIRCDTHGMYYGPLMGRHDPYRLRDPLEGTDFKAHYSWQTGGTHFCFYRSYYQPDRMTVPHVEGFVVATVWDEHPDAAQAAARVFLEPPIVCKTFEEVSDGVDMVLVADCNYDGSDHLELATPSLKKGVPTFVDKPFAGTYKDAAAMVELARKHGTPLLSLSLLRVEPQVAQFKNRFPEIGTVQFGVIRGGWDSLAGQIHAIAAAQHLFGPGVEKVESMGKYPLAYVHLDYGNRPDRPNDGVMLLCASGGGSFDSQYSASVYNDRGMLHSPMFADEQHPYAAVEVLNLCRQMVQTNQPPVPYEEMLEQIAIVDAARLAHKEKRSVALKEVMNR